MFYEILVVINPLWVETMTMQNDSPQKAFYLSTSLANLADAMDKEDREEQKRDEDKFRENEFEDDTYYPVRTQQILREHEEVKREIRVLLETLDLLLNSNSEMRKECNNIANLIAAASTTEGEEELTLEMDVLNNRN